MESEATKEKNNLTSTVSESVIFDSAMECPWSIELLTRPSLLLLTVLLLQRMPLNKSMPSELQLLLHLQFIEKEKQKAWYRISPD